MTEAGTGRPKYHLYQNTGFMISTAWRISRSVLFLGLLLAAAAAARTAAELFIAPVILRKIETHQPFWELTAAIAVFGAGLFLLTGLEAYIRQNTLFGRIAVRQEILRQIGNKTAGTSYPNTLNPDFLSYQAKSYKACYDNTSPAEGFWTALALLLTNVFSFLVWSFLLSGLSIWLLCLIVLISTAEYFFNMSVNRWGWRHRKEEAECHKKMDYICRISTKRFYAKDIRIFGLGPWLGQVWDSGFKQYKSFLGRREAVYFRTNLADGLSALIRGGAVFVCLLRLVIEKGLSISEFFLYFTAANSFTMWITGILDNVSLLHRQSLELSVIREFLEWPEPFLFESGKRLSRERDTSYELRLENVSFAYPGSEQNTISHMNLVISPGEKVAVVGLNGAGKTTLVKLLCGFLDPVEGRVLLNGEDIRQYNRRDYYGLFAAVFQDFSVLDASVAENVAQTVDGVDRERVRECIALAGLTEKAESLPKGLDTKLGRQVYEDGVELSGGQTQRLMLARALYKNAPLMILDEPTAALDPIAEHDIYQKYNQMAEGRTCLFISHRLASTRFCDRILFLDRGQIAEEGTHRQLLDKKGPYADLFEIQSRYYRQEGEGHGWDSEKGFLCSGSQA